MIEALSLSGLPEPFAVLSDLVRESHYPAGECVFRTGSATRGMFLLASGRIHMCRYSAAGQSIPVYTARAGESFAEASLYSDHYHCDAIAVVTSRVIEIPKLALMERLQSSPSFALAFNRQLALQIQQYRRRIELISLRSARERVLIGLSDGLLNGPIQDFAALLGLTREAVYRELSALHREGLIEKTGKGQYRYIVPEL